MKAWSVQKRDMCMSALEMAFLRFEKVIKMSEICQTDLYENNLSHKTYSIRSLLRYLIRRSLRKFTVEILNKHKIHPPFFLKTIGPSKKNDSSGEDTRKRRAH